MRILHIYKDYSPVLGGIENHIKTLAELQAGLGHEVSVLVTNPNTLPTRETVNDVQLIRLPRLATVASTPLTLSFLKEIRRQRPDITHLHFPYPIGEISQLVAGKPPYVITYHSDVVRQQTILRFYNPLLKRILRGAARILPTSEPYIRSSPYLAGAADKCTVVPLSVDPERFRDAHPLFEPARVPTLLFVGRHRYYKGLDDLLHAMVELDARLLIGGSGPETENWRGLTKQLALSEKVHFLGDIDDSVLPGLYASADIFVLPANSRAEAFGIVLLEAMASGLPCMTTELGTGTSYVVQDQQTGVIVPPQNQAALREGIQSLLHDASLREKMGKAGRQRILENFTPEKLAARVMAVYEEVSSLHRQGN